MRQTVQVLAIVAVVLAGGLPANAQDEQGDS